MYFFSAEILSLVERRHNEAGFSADAVEDEAAIQKKAINCQTKRKHLRFAVAADDNFQLNYLGKNKLFATDLSSKIFFNFLV